MTSVSSLERILWQKLLVVTEELANNPHRNSLSELKGFELLNR